MQDDRHLGMYIWTLKFSNPGFPFIPDFVLNHGDWGRQQDGKRLQGYHQIQKEVKYQARWGLR